MKTHLKYLSYVVRHKWFVLLAGLKTGAPIYRLLIHDWSKFLPCEWIPYARYFYEKPLIQGPFDRPNHALTIDQWKARLQREFDTAWLHHQHSNRHHWQHWVLRCDDGSVSALAMPAKYIREMVADWMGAGRAITGRWEAKEWYALNRSKMILHPHTQALVDGMLE